MKERRRGKYQLRITFDAHLMAEKRIQVLRSYATIPLHVPEVDSRQEFALSIRSSKSCHKNNLCQEGDTLQLLYITLQYLSVDLESNSKTFEHPW